MTLRGSPVGDTSNAATVAVTKHDVSLLMEKIKDIVQPKKRGVERGTIRTVLASYTIADNF